MPDEIFSESKSALRAAFDAFCAGNNRLAFVAIGGIIGSSVAISVESGGKAHVSYGSAAFHIQVLFWALGLFIALTVVLMPNKFQSRRWPLGTAYFEDGRDVVALLGSAAVSGLLLTALSEFLA